MVELAEHCCSETNILNFWTVLVTHLSYMIELPGSNPGRSVLLCNDVLANVTSFTTVMVTTTITTAIASTIAIATTRTIVTATTSATEMAITTAKGVSLYG